MLFRLRVFLVAVVGVVVDIGVASTIRCRLRDERSEKSGGALDLFVINVLCCKYQVYLQIQWQLFFCHNYVHCSSDYELFF